MDRPEITEPLREKLLSGASTLALTAIEGMGGVGKTVVALGLCHNPQVREAFPDGIVWLTIGKESSVSLEEQIKGLAAALNQEFQVYSPAAYRSLLQGKQILVVVDDVWKQSDVEPFLPGPGEAKLLYTSRDKTLAGPLGAKSEEVGVLEQPQARRFLARWSGRENLPLPEPAAECKGPALGLAMIGAALRGQPGEEWGYLLGDLKKTRLKHIATRPGGYAYETLHASIKVSVDALDPDSKARYPRLAVLLEDMSAPEALLRILWGGEKREVHRTARLLVDRSLPSRESEGIRLHDFQLDSIRGALSPRTVRWADDRTSARPRVPTGHRSISGRTRRVCAAPAFSTPTSLARAGGRSGKACAGRPHGLGHGRGADGGWQARRLRLAL